MDICRVLQNLKIANDHLLAFENADYKNIPPENLANINYEQLKRASDFAKQQLIKELKGKENGVTSKTTILNIYGKICLWVQSIIKMDGPECCLALASSVRAILELFIDLNLIDRDIIKYGVDKYFSFPRVEKYRRAKSIVEKRKKLLLNIKTEDQFLSKSENSESNINTLRKKWWGKSKKGNPVIPDHWTNKTLWQRIEELNDQNIVGIYFSSYYYANWCVHSMYFDMINDINNVHLFNWHLYELAYKMFRSSTELLNNIFQVLKKDDLDDSFNKVEEETFKSFLGQMLIAGRNKDD